MRLVALGCRGDVRRGRVGIGRSVATVALCRHDLYSIYLIFGVMSPCNATCGTLIESPEKCVYHELVKKNNVHKYMCTVNSVYHTVLQLYT